MSTHEIFTTSGISLMPPFFGKLKDMPQDPCLHLIAFLVAAFHHYPAHIYGLIGLKGGKARGAPPTETRNKVTRKAGPEAIAAYSHHGPGIEHHIDTALAVVAHDHPTELKARFLKAFRSVVPQSNLSIVVLKVGIVGVRPQIAPFPQDRIAQIAVMALV